MVDSREGSDTAAEVADGGEDVAERLHLVLEEHLCPIRESLEAAGQNLSGLREKFATMEAALGGLLAKTEAGCEAKLGEARRAVEDLSASREAGKRLRDDNAVLRRDLEQQRSRQGVAKLHLYYVPLPQYHAFQILFIVEANLVAVFTF